MGFFEDAYKRYSPLHQLTQGNIGGAIYRMSPLQYVSDISGYSQFKNTQESTQAQIDYNNYLKAGNERALADWNRYVGSQGKTIQYPELSYAGQIYRANTASARAMFDADSAGANFFGNLPYRGAGLYGISSRLSRTL